MKLKYSFVTNEVAGNIVAVAVGDDAVKFNGFIRMNTTGAEIFKLLENEITADAVVEEMSKCYPDESTDTLKDCVEKFIAQLNDAGVLE